jgi:hypothetical protein
MYGAPLNHESNTKTFLFFVFQSVSRANTVNMNSPPLMYYVQMETRFRGLRFSSVQEVLSWLDYLFGYEPLRVTEGKVGHSVCVLSVALFYFQVDTWVIISSSVSTPCHSFSNRLHQAKRACVLWDRNFSRWLVRMLVWWGGLLVQFVSEGKNTSSKMAVFWVVAPCSLVEVYQRFRGSLLPPSSGREAARNLWNVSKLLPYCTVLQPRKQPSSYSPPWEPQILPTVRTSFFNLQYLFISPVNVFLSFGREPTVIFFSRNPGISEALEDMHWTQRGLC